MKVSRSRMHIIVILFLIILFLLVISQTNSTKVKDRVTMITAVLGFLAIIYQLQMDHKIKRAEFIYSLNDTFTSDQDITYIYMKLKESRDSEVVFSADDGKRMGSYIMFFLILNYLEKENLITLQMMDSLFANKFFLLCNNKYVQKYQLDYTELNYGIIELYQKWYNYRVKKKLAELYSKDSFSKYKKFFTKGKNGAITFNNDHANLAYDRRDM